MLSASSIAENGGVSTVTATLSGVSSEAVTLTVATTAVSPAMQADFTRTGSSLTIAAGATTSTGTVTVTAVANTTDAPDKRVTVAASAAGGNGVADPSGVTLAIPDDDAAPNATLSVDPTSVTENGGISTVTATLSHPSSQPSTVTVSAASGLYTVGTDATITIAVGATAAATDTVLVTAVNDDIHQGSAGRNVTVSAALTNGQGAGAVTGASLTLTDDETLPTAALVLSPASITETGGVSTVTATLSGASSAAVTVTVGVAAGTGAAAADFSLGAGTTLTIAAGSTASAGTVTVTANGNTVDSPNKTVTVSGTASGGNGVANPSNATLTITDDDALPTVALALSDSSISETGGVSTVTATLSGASSAAVTVTVAAAAGTGAVSGDFDLSSTTTLTIAAGSTTSAGTVTVTANGNTTDSPNKEVTVSGTAAGGNGVSNPSNVTLTLEDDDALPTVALVLSPTSITETNGVSTVTARLSGASSAAVTVTVSAAAETGAVSGDFGLSSTTTLTIAAGSTTSAGTVTVTANGNTVDTPNKSVMVSGTATGGNGVANPSDVTLTLTDDDALPTVALVLSPSSISETNGVSTVTATLSGASSEAVTVTVAAAAGTGAVAGDFALSGTTTLTIAAGSTTSAGTVTVTANGNDVDAPNKEVAVSGTAAGGNGVSDPSDATLTITDDDALPTVSLVLSPTSITETGGVSTVTATLTGKSSGAVTVTVAAAAVSSTGAVSGDFTLSTATTLTIAAGSTASAGTVTVTAEPNDVDAADKSVTVSGTASGGNNVSNPSNVTLTLEDDDTAGIAVSPSTSTTNRLVTTESGGTATFEVELDSEPTGNVVLGVASSDTDEGTVSPSALTFTPSDWDDVQTVTLTGVDDTPAAADGSQNYTATLTVNQTATQDSTYDALSALTVYVRNRDNEFGLAVGSVSGAATESGGTATFAVALQTQPTAAVTVAVTSLDTGEGTVSPSSLTFTTSGWNTALTVTVTGVRDTVDDGTETWAVRLDPSSGDADYDGLDSEDVSMTTTDDDGPPGVVLSVNPAGIAESGAGNVSTVTARLSHPSGAATTLTVTAVAGAFTVGAGADATIVIAAGATTGTDTATVAAVDNTTDEPDRTATVTATVANARAAADSTTMAVTGATLTLTDDDAAPTAALSLNPTSVSENGGIATVTATLSHPSSEPSTVTVAAVSGLYTVGADATITITAGMTAAASDTVLVTAVDDSVHQGSAGRSATVTASLANGQGAGSVTGATLTLTDDETRPTVALVLAPGTISENGGVSTVTATLSGVSDEAVTVTVAAAAGMNAVAGDFSLSTATTLTIAVGSTVSAGTVTVTAVDDTGATGSMSVTVSGTAAGGNGVAAPADVTLTITDDDAPQATLVLSSSPITENGGVATVTARLDRQSSAAVTVTVAAAAVSPTAAGDFTLSAATTLTFAANATASTGLVTVTATDNAVDAPDKGVTVSGTASDSLGLTNDPPAVTLTITDDEAAPTVVLSLNPASVSENGGESTVTAVLSHPSSEPTTVTVTGVAGAYTAGSDAMIVIAAGSTAAASDTATVTAVDDRTYQGSAGRSVTVTAMPANGHGAGSVTGATLSLTDDDTLPMATLVLTPASIPETGGVSTVTAMLAHPTGDATTLTVAAAAVPPASSGDFTLGPARTLTVAAGSTASTGAVTVTAVRDPDPSEDRSVTVSATASGGLGVAAPPDVTLEILDVRSGLVLDPAVGVRGRVTEGGGTATFAVALLTRPSAAVTVAVTGLDATEGRVAPSVLTFATGNWGTARTVTVTGADDDIDDGDVSWQVRLDPSSGDAGYAGLADAEVDVTTTDDDDAPEVELSLEPPSVSEAGGVSTVTAVLSHPSVADTTVTVSAAPVSPATEGDYTLSLERMLTIAAGATRSTGTVTVTATDNDTDAADKRVTVSATAANARAAADGTAVAVTGAVLTIADDDEKGIAFEPGGPLPTVAGAGAAAYTAALTSRPVGTVTVSISTDDADLAVSPSVLTFAPSDWSGARTVSVTARPDGDDLADAASLVTHAASGGGYDGVTGTLAVAVSEPGDTRIVTDGAAGTTTRYVNGRQVTVTVAEGVPADVGIALPQTLNGAVTVTVAPLPGEDRAAAAGDGYGLGPEGSQVAVDIAVAPVPRDGVRLCLPVDDALRAAAAGRELIMFRNGERVASSPVRSDGDGPVIRVCADGVASFSPFALGYEDTKPEFDFTLTAMVFTVDEAIGPVTLRQAKGGDGTGHELGPLPLVLPPGLGFDDGTRVLSGTPTEVFAVRRYVWTATDIDGDKAELAFTIEVVPAPVSARDRLAAINRSVLPELARATWGSVTDALAARLESPGAPGGDVAASGLTGAAEFLRSNERAIEEGSASWRELLGGESFAVGLGSGAPDGGGGGSPAVVWGSGDWRRLALDKPELEWSGDLFSAHVGVDAPLGEGLRGGLAASWTEGEIEYADRSGDDGEIAGVHTSRLAAVHPYAGWSAPDGSRLWGALGYGEGRVEISDDEVMERFGIQKAGSAFMGVAVGGSAAPLVLSDGLAVSLRGSGEATRYSVKDNGSQIAAVTVDTRRVRLAAEANRTWALPDGGTLTPALEVGGRWDGGDGETGAGMELGGGLEWVSDGLAVGARGRALVAHRGAVEEWGVSGSARLSPGPGGRGWSFALTPRWGAAESGLARLWDEGMADRVLPGAAAAAHLETELGYGFALRRGAGVMTPHAGFDYEAGGARRYRLGTRFAFGPNFAVGLEAEREEGAAGPGHGARIDLRLKW